MSSCGLQPALLPSTPVTTSSRCPRRVFLWAIFAGALACVNDVATGPDAGPDRAAALSVHAQVTGLRAAGPYSVDLAVSYEAAGGARVPLPVSRESFEVQTGGTQTQETIEVILDPCLQDSGRAQASSGGCQLWLDLMLSDAEGELDTETVDLGIVRDRDQVASPAAIVLVPRYTLTIAGGGEGAGSGTVVVPPADGQPALACEISDGIAAASGCTGRYQLHTELALTPAAGNLETWGGDCSSAPSTTLCQVRLDGRRRVEARFVPEPTTGALRIEIAGLPSGIAGQVTVSRGTAFSQTARESTILPALEPGEDYVVTAAPVSVAAEERTYTPTPAEQQVTIVAGDTTQVQIGYNPPETGSLAVTILGLPTSVAALVRVSGPGLAETLTATRLLSGLAPEAAYTSDAATVETAEQVYDPTPVSQTSSIVANETVHDTVTYTATRGSLAVAISGLPGGSDAAVTVTGPGGFRTELIGTTPAPLTKLIPGTYDVAAADVRVAGRTYRADQGSRAVTITAGGGTVASVGYSVLPPVRLERISEDGVICTVNTFCEDLFQVRALDAAGNPVAGAIVRWTAGNPSEGCPVGSSTDVTADGEGIAHASNQCRYPTPGTYQQTAALVVGGQVLAASQVTFSFVLTRAPVSSTQSTLTISVGDLKTCCDSTVVTVTARDGGGAPIPGATIELGASGRAVTLIQPAALTNAQGVAIGYAVGRANGTEVEISARVDGVLLESREFVNVSAGIAFVADGDIYAISQDGGTPTNLTRHLPALVSSPAWSPDGSGIAFTVTQCFDDVRCFRDIYAMNADGTDTVNLTAAFAEDASAPTWSPDASLIAFEATRPCGEDLCRSIYLMRANGFAPIRLTTELETAVSPDWSPDGTRIVAEMEVCEEECASALVTMDAKGSSRDTLTGLEFPQSPKWSPDGARIAFARFTCNEECGYDIATVTLTGTDLVTLTEGLDGDASSPAWSPVGGRIAFAQEVCEGDLCFSRINIMSSRDGSGLTPLATGSEPSWR